MSTYINISKSHSKFNEVTIIQAGDGENVSDLHAISSEQVPNDGDSTFSFMQVHILQY